MEVFENESFLVVDKPSAVLSIPSREGEIDPRPCALRDWSKQKGVRLWPVHRLDFEVSGLLIFAKTPDAHRAANQWFERHTIRKRYEALTEIWKGEIPSGEVEWRSQLWRGKRRVAEKPFGKKAVTKAKFLEKKQLLGAEVGHWELWPLTGRPHQLRYELSKHGFPVWGDALYGGTTPFPAPDVISLRAVSLELGDVPEGDRQGFPARLDARPLLLWLDSAEFVPIKEAKC